MLPKCLCEIDLVVNRELQSEEQEIVLCHALSVLRFVLFRNSGFLFPQEVWTNRRLVV